ncbi:MAG: hypothetical protein ABIA04_02680 [Pseudomonadota bacterium]
MIDLKKGQIIKTIFAIIICISFIFSCSAKREMDAHEVMLKKKQKNNAIMTLDKFITQTIAVVSSKYYNADTNEGIKIAVLDFKDAEENITILTKAIADSARNLISKRSQFALTNEETLNKAIEKFNLYQADFKNLDLIKEAGDYLSVLVFITGEAKKMTVGTKDIYKTTITCIDAKTAETIHKSSAIFTTDNLIAQTSFDKISETILVEKKALKKGYLRIIYKDEDPLQNMQQRTEQLITKFDYSYEQFISQDDNPHDLIAQDHKCAIDGIAYTPDEDGFCASKEVSEGNHRVTFSYVLKQKIGEIYNEIGTVKKMYSVSIKDGEKISILAENRPQESPPSVTLKSWKTMKIIRPDNTSYLNKEEITLREYSDEGEW